MLALLQWLIDAGVDAMAEEEYPNTCRGTGRRYHPVDEGGERYTNARRALRQGG